MSEHRQSRNPDRHPIRKATPTRQSASGPGDRVASFPQVAGFLREDCRTLRDSLQLEMVLAQYGLRIRDVLTPEGVPVGDAAAASVVGELERHGDPLSHAILRGMARVGIGDVAARSADAIARLGERGVGITAKFADVGEARPLGAWRDSEGAFHGEFVLFVDFEHPLGARHSLAMFVEPRHGGVIKHLGLMKPVSELDAGEQFHPDAMEPVELGTAAELLQKLVERSYGWMLADTDDYRVLIAAARARSMAALTEAAAGS